MEEGNDAQVQTNPFPEVPSQGEMLELELPVGSFDIAQEIYKSVQYGAFVGKARKKVAKPEILSNPGKLVTAALCEVIDFPDTKYEDMAEKRLLIRHMYSADRTACVFAIRKATRRQPIVQTLDCPACTAKLQITTDPSELEFVPLEKTKFVLDEVRREYLYRYVSSEKDVIEFKLPRGILEEGLTASELQNIGESSQKVLAACIHTFNGEEIFESFFDDVSTGYQDELSDEFSDEQPGWDLIKEAQCTECLTSVDYRVDVSDFLLPNARRKRFSRRGKR